MYGSGDEDVLVARITTQRHVTETDYRIVDWQRCGLLAESFIRLGKQATIQKRYITKQLGALEPEGIDGISLDSIRLGHSFFLDVETGVVLGNQKGEDRGRETG